MANAAEEKLLIESKFEDLISKSKSYIKNRDEAELAQML